MYLFEGARTRRCASGLLYVLFSSSEYACACSEPPDTFFIKRSLKIIMVYIIYPN